MIKKICATLMSLGLSLLCLTAQNVPTRMDYPGMLWSENDTFYVHSPNWSKVYTFTTTGRDTVDVGTDGYPGVYVKVWTTTDTLTIPYTNAPYEQWLFIPVGSDQDTTVYQLRFNAQNALYSNEYAEKHRGSSEISIPETYELANVMLYLTDCSVKTANHNEKLAYAKEVGAHFGPYRNHPIIRILNEWCADDAHWPTYYGFRENSICYRFQDGFLVHDTPYKHVFGDDIGGKGGEFRALLYLVQDFAAQSRFQDFFAQHKTYYESLEKRQAELLPVKQMWTWMEKEFPQRKDSYKVYFSPLIEGSHSTQQFYKGYFREPEFQECVMFINAPEGLDVRNGYSEKLKEGLMSGIVFTEIDHNYVNPTSGEYIDAVKTLISDKNFWATAAAQQNYQSEYAIFNEYMTHALFCLYVSEIYDKVIADQVIEKRIALMERRGYPQFKAFNAQLLQMMKNRDKTVYEAYGAIIEAMHEIAKKE